MSKKIEVESCMDCRFSATDLYNGKICNLGIEDFGLFFPEKPPANCPLREGAITVRLKGTEPDYKAEVLKVYPDAVCSALSWNLANPFIISESLYGMQLTEPCTSQKDAWKSAYEHIKNNGK
jgi:hypothetical protein